MNLSFLKNAKAMLILVAVMWAVFLIDAILPININYYLGLDTGSWTGIIGVVAAPFLHGSFFHLLNNTFPFIILSALLFSTYGNEGWEILGGIAVFGGLATWLCGYLFFTPVIHVGASGVVFGIAGFIMAAGLMTKKVTHIVVGVLALILYGFPLLFGLIPFRSGVSYSGHWFGLLAGVLMAYLYNMTQNEPKDASASDLN